MRPWIIGSVARQQHLKRPQLRYSFFCTNFTCELALFSILTDVLVLNEIINQTAAVTSESSNNLEVVVINQPRNSLQSAGSGAAAAANGGNSGLGGGGGTTAGSEGLTSTAAALARARRQSRKISMMRDDDEDEGPRLKEKITEACQQFVDIFCVWDCCWIYIKLSEVKNMF